MLVAMYYRPNSASGSDIFSSKQDTAQAVQTCERCLQRQRSDKHIVTSATARCFSICSGCLNSKSVCAPAKKKVTLPISPHSEYATTA